MVSDEQEVTLLGSDEANSYPLYGKHVTVLPSIASSLQHTSSNKVTTKLVARATSTYKEDPGNLIDIHRSTVYIAYVLPVKREGDIIRVCNRRDSSKMLIKADTRVVDLAFAFTDQIILGVVDEMGSLFVYELSAVIDRTELHQTTLLHVTRPVATSSLRRRLVWSPYVPDEEEEASTCDFGKGLLLSSDDGVEYFQIDMIIAQHTTLETSQVPIDDITVGYCRLPAHPGVITTAAFSPEATVVGTACDAGCVVFCEYPHCEEEPISARELHRWSPHGNSPVVALLFLDDLATFKMDSGIWKYALTAGGPNATEVKLWECTNWSCLQSLQFAIPSAPLPNFSFHLSRSARFLLITDSSKSVIYSILLERDDSSNGAKMVLFSEFLLSSPIYDVAIAKAQLKIRKDSDRSEFVLQLISVHEKLIQEMIISSPMPVDTTIDRVQSTASLQDLLPDGFSTQHDNVSPYRSPDASHDKPLNGISEDTFASVTEASTAGSGDLTHITAPDHKDEISVSLREAVSKLHPAPSSSETWDKERIGQHLRDILLTPDVFSSSESPEKQKPSESRSSHDLLDQLFASATITAPKLQKTPSEASMEVCDIMDRPSPEEATLAPERPRTPSPPEEEVDSARAAIYPEPAVPAPIVDTRQTAIASHTRRSNTTLDNDSSNVIEALAKLERMMEHRLSQQDELLRELARRPVSNNDSSMAVQQAEVNLRQLFNTRFDHLANLQQKHAYRPPDVPVLAAAITNQLEPIMAKMLAHQLQVATSQLMEPVTQYLREQVALTMGNVHEIVRQSVNQALTSPVLIQQITTALTTSSNMIAGDAMKNALLNVLPQFDRSFQTMFQQMNEIFNVGTKQYETKLVKHLSDMKDASRQENDRATSTSWSQCQMAMEGSINQLGGEIEKQLMDTIANQLSLVVTKSIQSEMKNEMREYESRVEGAVTAALRSTAATPLPHTNTEISTKQQISELIRLSNYNQAFKVTLHASDLSVLLHTISLIPSSKVFTNPCQLDKPVVLSLIHQLPVDLSTGTEVKLKYLQDAILSLMPVDAPVAHHLQALLPVVASKLSEFAKKNPTSRHAPTACTVQLMANGVLQQSAVL